MHDRIAERARDHQPRRRRLAAVALAVVSVWVAVAGWLIPTLIRVASDVEPLPADSFVRLVVESSIDRWLYVAALSTLVLVWFCIFGLLHVRRLPRLAQHLRSVLDVLPLSGFHDMLLLAAGFGIIGGLAEAVVAWVRAWVLLHPAYTISSAEIFWITPLVTTCVLGVVGSMLLLGDRILGARGALAAVAPFVFAAMIAFGVVKHARAGLATWACALLACGIGAVAWRAMLM